MAATVSAFADVAAAVMSMATLGVALFVLITARSIQRAEGVFRQNQAWNEFGHAMAGLAQESRVGDLLIGKSMNWGLPPDDVASQLSATDAFLLMSFFNVVSNEYNAFLKKAIEDEYFIHSLAMTCRVVKSDGEWIFPFLQENGYEAGYVAFLRALADTDDCDARIALAAKERYARTRKGRRRDRKPAPAAAGET
jgi:hypothetical protein